MPMSIEPPERPRGNHTTGCAKAAVTLQAENQARAATPRFGTWTVLAFALWGLAVAAGSFYGFWYEITPAETDVALAGWPAGSACVLAADRPTLLMFVHPRCPCSRSSVSELAVLIARCQDRMDAQVLFYKAPASPEDWATTDLWHSAARIPGVVPRVDVAGAERRLFGASVSGEVFLFQPGGELSFHGGITAGRGHAGDNQGRSALESILLNRHSPSTTAPVYGCALESPTSLQQNTPPPVMRRRNHEL